MPRSIHAVTKKGVVLKAMLFVLAYAFVKYAVPPSEASFDTSVYALSSYGGHSRRTRQDERGGKATTPCIVPRPA